MAINTTTLTGKDSVAASRITINDNFATLKEALNDILSIVDIGTGKIDNSSFGSINNIETQNITINGTTGVEVNSGNIALNTGNLKLNGSSSRIEMGSNIKIEKVTKTLGGGPGSLDILDFSGTSGATSGTGPVGPLVIPRLSNADILDIDNPSEASLVWDVDNSTLRCWTGATWNALF